MKSPSKEPDLLERILQDATSASGWGMTRLEGTPDDSSKIFVFEQRQSRGVSMSSDLPATPISPVTPITSQLPRISEGGIESPPSAISHTSLESPASRPKEFFPSQVQLEDSGTARPIFNPFNSTPPEINESKSDPVKD